MDLAFWHYHRHSHAGGGERPIPLIFRPLLAVITTAFAAGQAIWAAADGNTLVMFMSAAATCGLAVAGIWNAWTNHRAETRRSRQFEERVIGNLEKRYAAEYAAREASLVQEHAARFSALSPPRPGTSEPPPPAA